jgi:hypothetical protein
VDLAMWPEWSDTVNTGRRREQGTGQRGGLVMGKQPGKKRRARQWSRAYLNPGRLEDILALIQLLGMDPTTHRTENAIREELRADPQSADFWVEQIAKAHGEFFRVHDGKDGPSASLIARHVLKDEGKKIPPDFVNGLVRAAIQIHEAQLQRRQVFRVASIGGFILGLAALASIASNVVSMWATLHK